MPRKKAAVKAPKSSLEALIVDLYAGGGGASAGIEAALGRPVDIAINHSAVALAVHKANHPRTRHLVKDIWEVKPRDATKGVPVGFLWASPDCTHFSVAKGDVPKSQGIRSLAWAVVRWARDVRPTVICLENVVEFRGWGPLGSDGKPVKAKMGQTFRRWKSKLESYGYTVDHQILDSSLYGAPTKRRRLFLVARCDGQPIIWPAPTHGPGLLPVHTAAECIDWSRPCPSIFTRKRPLAEKTLWRIAQGIRKFVLENPQPFIVGVGGRAGMSAPTGMNEPVGTVTGKNDRALVTPLVVKVNHGKRDPRGEAADAPLSTVTATRRGHALCTAFLAKHFGGVVGTKIDQPASTITAVDHHGLVTANLVKLRGTNHGASVEAPLPTVTAGGNHIGEVRAFLTVYYGSDGPKGQVLTEPMRTITAKHRLGLVTVHGTEYQIVDIGLRMLQPDELLRAQFGRFAASYDMKAAKTKAAKVRLIGNSVCPEVAEALVRSNFPTEMVARERKAA